MDKYTKIFKQVRTVLPFFIYNNAIYFKHNI